jgi:hypothetical protein
VPVHACSTSSSHGRATCPTYLDELGRQVERLEALPLLERVAAVGELLDAAAVLLAGSRRIDVQVGVDPLDGASELEHDADLLLGRRR